jgi:hypothetical protein
MLNHWQNLESSPLVIWSVIFIISLAAVAISVWLKRVFHR